MALSSQHTQVLIWIERFRLSCECEQTPSDAATHTLPALPLPGGWNGAQQLRIRQNVVKGQAQNNFLWNRANPFIGTATVQQKRQLSNTNRYKQLSFIIIFPYLLAWLMAVSLQWALSTFDLTLPQTSMSWTEKIWRQFKTTATEHKKIQNSSEFYLEQHSLSAPVLMVINLINTLRTRLCLGICSKWLKMKL